MRNHIINDNLKSYHLLYVFQRSCSKPLYFFVVSVLEEHFLVQESSVQKAVPDLVTFLKFLYVFLKNYTAHSLKKKGHLAHIILLIHYNPD